MKLRTITNRAIVAGAATALTAGALVAAAAPAANAATVDQTYHCAIPGLYEGDFPATVSGDLPVPQYWAGAVVPKDLLTLSVTATVPADAAGLLASQGVTGAKSDDFALSLGGGGVPVPVSGGFTTTDGVTKWNATGKNKAFTTADPGVVDGFVPETFKLQATKEDGSTFATLTCTATGDPAEIVSDFTLMRQSSETIAKNVTAKKGKPAVVKALVNSTSMSTEVLSGKVVAKEGKKTLGTGKVKNGKVSLNLGKKLKVGKHKVTVTYVGIPSIAKSSDKVTVTIKK